MLDLAPEFVDFAKTLEEVVISMVEGGYMTKDLAILTSDQTLWLTAEELLDILDENLAARLSR